MREYLQATGLDRFDEDARRNSPYGPQAADCAGAFAVLESRVIPCTMETQLAPELIPVCSRCNYVLGTLSPREALSDLLTKVRRALASKFTALSQSAIARLIRENDRDNRLEGFLKIVQAAQTDALIRVFDDQLARHLAQLLEENRAILEVPEGTARAKISNLSVAPSRVRRTKLNSST